MEREGERGSCRASQSQEEYWLPMFAAVGVGVVVMGDSTEQG